MPQTIEVKASRIITEITDRYHPATFFISNKGLTSAVKKTIDKLNEFVYLPRAFQASATPQYVLPSDVDRILRISFDEQIESFFNLYLPNFIPTFYSPFIVEDLVTRNQSRKLLERATSNAVRYEVHNVNNVPTLFLEDIPESASKMVVEYLPFFDRELEAWNLYPRERSLVYDYAYGVALYREGMMIRKSNYLEIDTDGDDLVQEGKEIMESIEDRMKKSPLFSFLKT